MPAAEGQGLRAAVTRRWQAIQQSRPGIAHLAAGYRHYQANHGNDLAAAITYYSFLSLFPLVLLGVSITAFVLASRPSLQEKLFSHIAANLPGGFGETVQQAIQVAIDKRAGVGLLGLIGVILAGLGWISNLRTAIDTVWGLPPRNRSFLAKKAADALVLVGLGLGVLVSVGLTAGGTAASGLLLRALGLDGVTGAGTLTWLLGILLGIAGSMVVYGWLMIRLPDIRVPRRVAVRVTLLAAVGFEVLKLVGTFYIARTASSPAAAAIGPVVGVLVWIYLVSRYLLFCVAWAATAMPAGAVATGSIAALLADRPAGEPAAPQSSRPAAGISPAAVAAGLLSAGAALGAGSLAAFRRSRSRATARRRSAR